MPKVTRIAYNSAEWQRPTGEARKSEGGDTYNALHGFGHEDWLFRSEWLIDGWRYAFIQGVNKSHAKLVELGQPVDLTLFTVHPDKKRRYVASIRAVECLSDQQAEDAVEEFKQRGWFEIMREEVRTVGGDPSALGAPKWAKHVLNVRFRLDNVSLFPTKSYATTGDPILKLSRYMLYDVANIGRSPKAHTKRFSEGSTDLPAANSFQRGPVSAVECTPEHARMQAKLMQELQSEFPHSDVRREQDFIDVSVWTDTEIMLFEIKSDLQPLAVIRQALGQILEYAFHPARQYRLPLRLVIVGRRELSPDDKKYLSRLRDEFFLPIDYRVVSLSH